MTTSCIEHTRNIPKAMLGDLSSEDQRALDLHLAECPACSREHRLYAEMMRQLHLERDEAVPRHFFIYPEETKLKPWQAFLRMSRAWQAAGAALVIGLGILGSLAIAGLHVNAKDGTLALSFGQIPATPAAPVQVRQADARDLEERILRIVEERSRRENLELIRSLRSEIARGNSALSRQQQAILVEALGNAETRMGQLVAAAVTNLEGRTSQSMQELYRTVSQDRERDLAVIDSRMNLLAASGEVKSSQTDAILATLLQVAELRLR